VRSAAIPHPGMADTHECPLKNLPKLYTRVTPKKNKPLKMTIVAGLHGQYKKNK